LISLDATVIRGGVRARIQQRVRRRRDLTSGEQISAALDRAERRIHARPIAPGRYAVLARASAFLHQDNGLLAALVGQTDPRLERHGLVRYRLGQPIAPGATSIDNPLTVSSDGAMPFGLHSAPLSDQTEPVRRFELIAHGVARGLALTARESALRGAEPNGGVRGLVVATGDIAADDLMRIDSPTLVVERFDWLDVAAVTGHFSAAIGLAQLIEGDRRTDLTGGILRGDAIAALALGRRSQETHATSEYRGPALWALGQLSVD
jgi:predicted Zn-dependent protease